MMAIWSLIKNEIRLNWVQMSWEVLMVLIGGCLFYLGFGYGLSLLAPSNLWPEPVAYLAGSIVVVVTFSFALTITQAASIRQFSSGQMNNIRATHLTIGQIYVGKSLVFLIETLAAMLLLTAVVFLLSQHGYRFGQLLLFWFILSLGSYLAVQLGLLLGCITNLRIQLSLTIFIVLPLLLISNFITPLNLWQKGLAYSISVLPTTSLITNCRMILIENRLNPLALIYLLMLNVACLAVGIYIYKRKLLR